MSKPRLTFTLCEKCGMHGRFTGTPDGNAVEVGSKCTAMVVIYFAVMSDAVPSEDIHGLFMTVLNSKLADVENPRDVDGTDGCRTCIDPELREYIAIWNDAARWTNNRAQFALSDFHEYVALLQKPSSNAPPQIPN